MAFSKMISGKLDAEQRARLNVEAGHAAALVLNNPRVQKFFSDQARFFLEGFAAAQTSELETWRTRIRVLDDFYVALQSAVDDGQANARSLEATK